MQDDYPPCYVSGFSLVAGLGYLVIWTTYSTVPVDITVRLYGSLSEFVGDQTNICSQMFLSSVIFNPLKGVQGVWSLIGKDFLQIIPIKRHSEPKTITTTTFLTDHL